MKRCFKCGKLKPLDDFYKHMAMKDGHLGKCKTCTKLDVSNRYNLLLNNPEWIEKERARGRDKYHRLNYYKKYFEARKEVPYHNISACKTIHKKLKLDSNSHAHHWNYNFIMDIFVLTLPLMI
jgi:hypothetical protein